MSQIVGGKCINLGLANVKYQKQFITLGLANVKYIPKTVDNCLCIRNLVIKLPGRLKNRTDQTNCQTRGSFLICPVYVL